MCGCSGDRHPRLPRCVVEGWGGSARIVSGAASAAVTAAAPATGGTIFPTASAGGAVRAPASGDGTAALTAAPATGGTVPSAASVGDRARVVSCSSSIGGNIGGGTGDQRYCYLGRTN